MIKFMYQLVKHICLSSNNINSLYTLRMVYDLEHGAMVRSRMTFYTTRIRDSHQTYYMLMVFEPLEILGHMLGVDSCLATVSAVVWQTIHL